MKRKYNYFEGDADQKFIIESMKKYVKEKQEMDKFLETLISPILEKNNQKILDACCGIGHIDYFLSELNHSNEFLGVDQTKYLIDEAKKICNKKNVRFEEGNIYDLPKKFEKFFDITINWKTISWIPYYDEFIKSLFKITKSHIFLSSLFYDGDIDFEIKVREYKKESGKDHFNLYYNVYSFPRFKEFLVSLGAKKIKSYDFEINKDLSKPPIDQMGTYTVKLENGKRMQISGAVVMMWKIIHVEL
jgi:ubiquinone/menaquinone biosynthesis C-methylase UbiE